jgi:RNA polymerase sigma-70 factor (ECF subfamily)
MSGTSLTMGRVLEDLAGGAVEGAAGGRIRALVETHYEFVWRSLRRLGVLDGDVEDAVQRVFIVTARKVDSIRSGAERAFLFQTALRVAADDRRARRRRREIPVADHEPTDSGAPGAEDLMDMRRARRMLDAILDGMDLELRAVFTLFELDQLTVTEIAELLAIPRGTVASRLRRAKAEFHEQAARSARQPGWTNKR